MLDEARSRRGTDAPRRRRLTAAMGNRYRRLVLLSLWETPGGVSVADVRPRSDSAERIERELRRVHLPMLEAAGYIEWDRETDEVTPGPNFGEIESLLEEGETILPRDRQ